MRLSFFVCLFYCHSRALQIFLLPLFPAKSVLKSKKEEISPLGSSMAKRPSGPLEVGTPFYQDGQLQVRVYWKNRGGTRGVRIHLAPCHVHPSAKKKKKCYDRFSLSRKMGIGIRRCKHNKRSSVSLWELDNVGGGGGRPKPLRGEEQ